MRGKLCPLLMISPAASGREVYCKGELCAWYNEDDVECAINTLGYLLGIKQNMDYINRIGGSNE